MPSSRRPKFIDHKVPSGKEAIRPSNTVSSCATAVKAAPVIGIEFVKPGTNKPVGVKSKPAVVESKLGNGEPTMVFVSDPVKAAGCTSIFVGVISQEGDC